MNILLERFNYSRTETEGVLTLPRGQKFFTIERPWVPGPYRGGAPGISCIPEGSYIMQPHVRPSGEEVFILSSNALGVYRYPDEHLAGRGRDLILIHAANWAHQVQGCIAPGIARQPLATPGAKEWLPAVTSSRSAMRLINEELGRNRAHVLTISQIHGAVG